MRLSGEMKDGINLVICKASYDVRGLRDIAIDELKVWFPIQLHDIIQRRAIIEFVEAEDVVAAVRDSEVSDNPRSTSYQR